MTQTLQSLFSFDDEVIDIGQAPLVDPVGTWNERYTMSWADIQKIIPESLKACASLPAPLNEWFAVAIEAGMERMQQWNDRDEPFEPERELHWQWERVYVQADAAHELVAQRETILGTIPGSKVTLRDWRHSKNLSMFVPGVGTLSLTLYPKDSDSDSSIHFLPWETTAHRLAYRDEAQRIYMPESQWSRQSCCSQLCENQDGVPSIKAVSHNGKLYAVSGAMYGGEVSEGTAWELVPRTLWKHQVFNYKQKIASYDNGSRYRGDSRGMLVKVGGREMVFGKPTILFDDRPGDTRRAEMLNQYANGTDSDDGADENEDLDFEDDDFEGEGGDVEVAVPTSIPKAKAPAKMVEEDQFALF